MHGLQSYNIETRLCVVCPYDYYYYVITLTIYLRHSQYRSRLFRSLLSCHTKFYGKSSESKQIIRADHAQPRFNIISLKTMVGWDLILYPILHQFFENDTVLCFPDVVWKVVENFCTTVSETSTFSSQLYFRHP